MGANIHLWVTVVKAVIWMQMVLLVFEVAVCPVKAKIVQRFYGNTVAFFRINGAIVPFLLPADCNYKLLNEETDYRSNRSYCGKDYTDKYHGVLFLLFFSQCSYLLRELGNILVYLVDFNFYCFFCFSYCFADFCGTSVLA